VGICSFDGEPLYSMTHSWKPQTEKGRK
jgi:hypothetical protein